MKSTHKRVASFISAALIIVFAMPISAFIVSANDTTKGLDGKVYEFSKKNDYEVSDDNYNDRTENSTTLGKLRIIGDISNTTTKNSITAYVAGNDSTLKIEYECNNKLANADEDEWHLTDDDNDEVNGIELDDDIDKGAIILETSIDYKNWHVNDSYVNVMKSGKESVTKDFKTNEVQLTNGCYYRVTVAYMLEKVVEKNKILPDKKDYKRIAEVYEFYASYKGTDTSAIEPNEKKYNLGTLKRADDKSDYSKLKDVESDDIHNGKTLGQFFMTGYTEDLADTDPSDKADRVFVKNVGDRVTLWFNLQQNIDKLFGNSDYKINNDKGVTDAAFGIPKTNFKRGALIVQYTDRNNQKHDPIIYTDYLAALCSPDANTKIQLFEEGDYKVALDYQIDNKEWLGLNKSYRISFSFKIRNGDCMVFPFDVKTKSELTDGSVTENGFYLDLAKSKYLKTYVKRSQWTKTGNGYQEDIRRNEIAKDGEQYTDEGIYTITVVNPTTDPNGINPTKKQIYVGTNNLMKAAVNPANKKYSIDEIAAFVDKGASISADGTIVFAMDSSSAADSSVTTTTQTTMSTDDSSADDEEKSSIWDKMILWGGIGAGSLVLIIIAVVVINARSSKGNKK